MSDIKKILSDDDWVLYGACETEAYFKHKKDFRDIGVPYPKWLRKLVKAERNNAISELQAELCRLIGAKYENRDNETDMR